MGTNKAEELNLDILLKKHGFSRSNLGGYDIVNGIYSDIKRVIEEYRQSEIDELTKERDEWKKECGLRLIELTNLEINSKVKIHELTKEVERLMKGIRSNQLLLWLRENNYINKDFDNIDLKEIYIKYLTTH